MEKQDPYLTKFSFEEEIHTDIFISYLMK